jgi:hypothetical protein
MLDSHVELRKSSRRSIRRAAWIELGDQRPPVRCVLWDISAGGARLTAARIMGDLPDQFVVSSDHEQWTCRVVWRDRRFLGVRFVGHAP